MVRRSRESVVCTLLLAVGMTSAVTADYPIAGTQPSQRPATAPQITTVDHSGQWYSNALRGISKPYPLSLRFLENQGNWYTPFTRPGMPGRYDIRGWHSR